MKTTWRILLVLLLLAVPAAAQAQFTYLTNASGVSVTITGYTGSGGAVTIPSAINGLTVTSIGTNAFYENYGLTSLTISGSVTNIGADAFEYCQSLTRVTIDSGVTSIGDEAFYSCFSLASLTIPASVTEIGASAFEVCPSLDAVTIPDGVTSIGEAAFAGTGLASVTIPASVTDIGELAFGGCPRLAAIGVDAQNMYYSTGNGVLFDKNQTTLVEYPDGLGGSYTIPDGVNTIGEDAFAGTVLTNVTIPGSVTSIGVFAFASCQGLSSITIPGSVSNIANYAFDSCTGLTNILMTNGLGSIGNFAFYYCTNLASATIPGSVTTIGEDAFAATSLTSVTIPVSVTNIGANAFAGSELTNATIAAGVTNIGNDEFSDCTNLISVTIPNSVLSIGADAFSGCTGLTGVTIPDSVTSIGADAFVGCTSLTSVTIPGSVLSIGASAFQNCTKLTNAVLANGIASLGTQAFQGCAGLTNITVPGSVTNLGADAFAQCGGLTSVYFTGNAPAADATVFSGDSNATVYYLPGATGWSAVFAGRPAVEQFTAPFITEQPVNQLVQGASSATLTVAALGTQPIAYLWQFDGNEMSGATNASVVVTNAGSYLVVVTNIYGAVTSSVADLTIERTNAAHVSVTVSITSPSSGGRTSLAFTGKASDTKNPIWSVFYWATNLNAGQTVTSGQAALSAGSPAVWSVTNLLPGTNIVAVQAFDLEGDHSAMASRKFFYAVAAPLRLATQGAGSVSVKSFVAGEKPTINALNIGESYQLTAQAGASSLFSGWTVTTANQSTSSGHAAIIFVMETNLSLTADFVSNIYLGAAGTYNGLFAVSNELSEVTEATAGMIAGLVVRTNGDYSGKLWIGGAGYTFSGAFDAYGGATNEISHPGGPLLVEMTLDASTNPPQIFGTVSGTSGTPWTAELVADHAGSNWPAAAYTMLIPPGTNAPPTNSPGGYGYALLANAAATRTTPNTVQISGALADGTTFSQTVPVSADGYVPFYDSLYSNKGLLLGWINLENPNTNGAGLAWIHPETGSGLYTAGFVNIISSNEIELSPWTNPPAGLAALTNLVLAATLPGASDLFEVPVTVSNNFNLGGVSGSLSVTGSITPKTGLLKVTFGHGSSKTNGFGAILLNAGMGGGYFLTRTNAQSIQLTP